MEVVAALEVSVVAWSDWVVFEAVWRRCMQDLVAFGAEVWPRALVGAVAQGCLWWFGSVARDARSVCVCSVECVGLLWLLRDWTEAAPVMGSGGQRELR